MRDALLDPTTHDIAIGEAAGRTENRRKVVTEPSVGRGGKAKRSIASLRIERRYDNVLILFLSGRLPNFTHQRHVHVANILKHLPYGRELMHLGLQTMAYRNNVPDKYNAEITDYSWDQLDGALPDPAAFDDLPGGADGNMRGRCTETP